MQRRIKIKMGAPGDGARISKLFQKAVFAIPVGPYSTEQLAAWAERGCAERMENKLLGLEFFLAEEGQRLLGFSALNVKSEELEYLYTDPDFSRQGVGTLLCQTAEGRAKELGLTSLGVIASSNAATFYENMGYKLRRTITREIDGLPLACVQMEKQI